MPPHGDLERERDISHFHHCSSSLSPLYLVYDFQIKPKKNVFKEPPFDFPISLLS